MSALIIANMAPLMFASLVLVLLLGYPVAFALAFNGLAWGIVGIELGLFSPNFFQALPDRNETAFYAGVKTTMDALNQDYARAGVDTGRLASADLRKDFDEVPACA